MLQYATVPFSKLPQELLDRYGFDSYDYGEVLLRIENGVSTVVFVDGGESEDMLLCRDLSRFVDELKMLAGKLEAATGI